MLTNQANDWKILYELLTNRSDNEAFCLAETGKQYAIYFNDGGSVSLDMSETQGNFHMKWLEIAESEWGPVTTITGGDIQNLKFSTLNV